MRAEGARNKEDFTGDDIREKGDGVRVSVVNVLIGDNNAAVDFESATESESFFKVGSDKTLITEYTGTVIVDEFTEEVDADSDDLRDVYSVPAVGALID